MGNVLQLFTKGGRNYTYTKTKFLSHRSFLLLSSGSIPQTCFRFGFGSTNRTSAALLVGSTPCTMQFLFRTQGLEARDWLWIVLEACSVFVLVELEKIVLG